MSLVLTMNQGEGVTVAVSWSSIVPLSHAVEMAADVIYLGAHKETAGSGGVLLASGAARSSQAECFASDPSNSLILSTRNSVRSQRPLCALVQASIALSPNVLSKSTLNVTCLAP